MAKKLISLNIWDGQDFKNEWREKEKQLERKVKKERDLGYSREFRDIETITSQFLKDGQNVVEIFGWGLPAIPSFIKSKVGKGGEVYSIDADPDFEYELFLNFVAMCDSFKRIKKGVEPDSHYQNKGTPLGYIRNEDYLPHLEEAFRNIDVEYAKRLKTDSRKPEAKKELLEMARQFYDSIGIEQVTQLLPPYPKKLRECSIDAVFEHNGFTFCYEEQKEGIVTGADKILKPGGHIIFKDDPRQLITVQYYGTEIFKERYSQIIPEGMHNPHNWLVLRKGI